MKKKFLLFTFLLAFIILPSCSSDDDDKSTTLSDMTFSEIGQYLEGIGEFKSVNREDGEPDINEVLVFEYHPSSGIITLVSLEDDEDEEEYDPYTILEFTKDEIKTNNGKIEFDKTFEYPSGGYKKTDGYFVSAKDFLIRNAYPSSEHGVYYVTYSPK